MQTLKKKLRQQVADRIERLAAEEVAEASRRICGTLLELPPVRAASYLAVYAAFGKEIDLGLLIDARQEYEWRLCFPRFDVASRCYEMVAVETPATDLAPGHWGLLEPEPKLPAVAEQVRLNELTWIVPGLAFDEEGRRLGRGGGYYDRMLANSRGPRIAVAHDCQIVPEVPVDVHDSRIDILVTGQRLIHCHQDCT